MLNKVYDTPTALQVLQYVDEFAGQENTAEEVRDFVQKAAQLIARRRAAVDWYAHPDMVSFMEWRRARMLTEQPKYCFHCAINGGWFNCEDGDYIGRSQPEGWRIGAEPADWKVIQ